MAIITISTILNAQEVPKDTMKKVTVKKITVEKIEDLYAKDNANNENYRAIRIGDQVWTINPIKNKKYSDGKNIPLIIDPKLWESNTSDAFRN